MTFPITASFAVLCAAFYVFQTFSVIAVRRSARVVHGDGGDKTLLKRIRGHGNSAEQMPLFLILLGLSEVQGANATLLCVIGTVFVIGRVLHGAYFLEIGLNHKFRMFGMLMTLTGQIVVTITLALALIL